MTGGKYTTRLRESTPEEIIVMVTDSAHIAVFVEIRGGH
jgi:hypothetical protein